MTNNPPLHRSDGVTLKEYIDTRFNEAQRAIDKAEATMTARLATMNEFRETLRDQAAKFVTRDEMGIQMEKVCEDVKSLKTIADIAKGKASQSSMIFSYAISIISLVIAIASLIMRM